MRGALVKRGVVGSRLHGYIGSLEELTGHLGVTMEEARVFRLTVMDLYLSGVPYSEIVSDLSSRGYSELCIDREYRRCGEIERSVLPMFSGGISGSREARNEFMDRVMCVGGLTGELSKDEVVSILSGIMLDSRVDIPNKLKAADLIGRYRDYFKTVDRDIRIVVEGGNLSSDINSIPLGVEMHGS